MIFTCFSYNMAGRILSRGFLRLAPAVRPATTVRSPRWLCTASIWQSKQQQQLTSQCRVQVNISMSHPLPTWNGPGVQVRGMGTDSAMSLEDLQKGVLSVVKMFDKVDSEKVASNRTINAKDKLLDFNCI